MKLARSFHCHLKGGPCSWSFRWAPCRRTIRIQQGIFIRLGPGCLVSATQLDAAEPDTSIPGRHVPADDDTGMGGWIRLGGGRVPLDEEEKSPPGFVSWWIEKQGESVTLLEDSYPSAPEMFQIPDLSCSELDRLPSTEWLVLPMQSSQGRHFSTRLIELGGSARELTQPLRPTSVSCKRSDPLWVVGGLRCPA